MELQLLPQALTLLNLPSSKIMLMDHLKETRKGKSEGNWWHTEAQCYAQSHITSWSWRWDKWQGNSHTWSSCLAMHTDQIQFERLASDCLTNTTPCCLWPGQILLSCSLERWAQPGTDMQTCPMRYIPGQAPLLSLPAQARWFHGPTRMWFMHAPAPPSWHAHLTNLGFTTPASLGQGLTFSELL